MGKHKKNRRFLHRDHPTGVLSMGETEELSDAEEEEDQKTPAAIANLSSTEPHEKEVACQSIASFVFDTENIFDTLKQYNAYKDLVLCVLHPDLAVRVAAAGAIRNISLVGGDEECEELVKKDVLTSLFGALYKGFPRLSELSTLQRDEEQREEWGQLISLFVQILSALATICEHVERATVITSKEFEAVKLFLTLLTTTNLSLELQTSAAQLLLVITDNNQELAKLLTATGDVMSQLQSMLNSPDFYIKTMSAGILLNVGSCIPSFRVSTLQATVPFLLTTATQLDLVATLLPLAPKAAQLQQKQDPTAAASSSPVSSSSSSSSSSLSTFASDSRSLYQEAQQWKRTVFAQECSFELLTNALSGEEDEQDADHIVLPADVHGFIIQNQVFTKVLAKCILPPAEVFPVLSTFSSALDVDVDILRVSVRALTCLTNLLMSLQLSEIPDIGSIWNLLSATASQTLSLAPLIPAPAADSAVSHTSSIQVASTCAGSMLVLLKRALHLTARPQILTVNHFDLIAQLISGSLSSQEEEAEELRQNCLALLGCMAQWGGIPAHVLETVGRFFVDRLSLDPSLRVKLETVNSVIDVFAEPVYNAVVKETNMLPALEATYVYLRNLPRTADEDEETTVRMEEALENIPAFLEYKRKQW